MSKVSYERTAHLLNEEETFEVVATPVVPENTTMDRTEGTEQHDEAAIMMGAFAVGGCVGCIMGGPILACAMGLGFACGTTCPSGGACGNCSRTMGRMALRCHAKASEANAKHRVVEKSRQAAVSCWNRSRDANERHKIVERTKQCISSSWEGIKATNDKYRIVDRSMDGVGRTCAYLSDKIIGEDKEKQTEESPAPDASEMEENSVRNSQEGEDRLPSTDDQKRKGGYVAVKSSGEN